MQNDKTRKEWENTAIQMYKDSKCSVSRFLRIVKKNKKIFDFFNVIVDKFLIIKMKKGKRAIDIITKCWLQKKGIKYDTLTIERGSEDVSDPQGHFKNRFYISKKKKICFFVEDDFEKASKLAYICDVVFLIKQSYNQNKKIPKNVIEVDSWKAIYDGIKSYL